MVTFDLPYSEINAIEPRFTGIPPYYGQFCLPRRKAVNTVNGHFSVTKLTLLCLHV